MLPNTLTVIHRYLKGRTVLIFLDCKTLGTAGFEVNQVGFQLAVHG